MGTIVVAYDAHDRLTAMDNPPKGMSCALLRVDGDLTAPEIAEAAEKLGTLLLESLQRPIEENSGVEQPGSSSGS